MSEDQNKPGAAGQPPPTMAMGAVPADHPMAAALRQATPPPPGQPTGHQLPPPPPTAGAGPPPPGGAYASPPGSPAQHGGAYAVGAAAAAPPAGQVPAAGAPPATGGNKNMMIAAGVGGGLVFVALALGVGVALSGGSGGLPFDHGQLPSETYRVSRWNSQRAMAAKAGVSSDDIPEQAYWSSMATACGGYDVFREMMGAPLKFGRKYAAEALVKDLDSLQQSLKCGKAMAESVGQGPRYWVVFGDGKHTRRVLFFAGGPDELPEPTPHFKTAADPSHMVDAHCLVPWDEDRSDKCSDNARAIARVDKTDIWARGGLKSLEAFGDDFSPDGKNSSSASERLADMASEFSGYDSVTVGDAEHFSTSYASTFGAGVGLYDKDENKDLVEAVDDSGRLWATGIKGERGSRELKLVIVASTESGAKDIKSALKDFQSALKDAIDERQEKEEDAERDEDEEEKYLDYIEARRKMARRAIKAAKIERDGKRVILIAEEDAKDGERKKLERYAKWRLKHVGLAAKVVDALMKGEEPSESLLEKLGGDEFIEAYDAAKEAAE